MAYMGVTWQQKFQAELLVTQQDKEIYEDKETWSDVLKQLSWWLAYLRFKDNKSEIISQ